MTLQRLTRISLLAALCVALRQAFCPFPKCPTYFCHLFLLVIFEGYSFCFSCDDDHHVCLRLFPGDEPDCVLFRLSPLAVWCSFGASVTSGCPMSFRSFCGPTVLCFYGVLIDTVYALIYHIPWWTYALVNGFSFNLAHALSTIIFYPIIYQIF